MLPLLIIGLLALAAAGAYWGWYQKKKRREGLAFAARQLGLRYSQEDVQGCLGLPFALLRRGDGRGTENVLWGTWQQMELREFDYWYYEESTDAQGHRTKTYSHYSCAVTEIPAVCSPLTIDRENLFTRIADAIGLEDIAFETEEFNDAFNVKSKDRKFANDLIDPRMMRWLLSTRSEFAFEACGPWLLCFSKRRKPLEIVPLLGTLKGFRDQVPRVLYELYPDGSAPARAEMPPDPLLPARPDLPPA